MDFLNKSLLLRSYFIYFFFFNFKSFRYLYRVRNNSFLKNIFFFVFNKYYKSSVPHDLNYDLLFRFSNYSMYTTYLNSQHLQKNINKVTILSKRNFFIKFPTVNSLGSHISNVSKRLFYIAIGKGSYLPQNYTLSGYHLPLIIKKRGKVFFNPSYNFCILPIYNLHDNNCNSRYKKYKSYLIFNNLIPNTQLNLLNFFMLNKKKNFLSYSNFFKQYNLYTSKNKSSFKILKFNSHLANKSLHFEKTKSISHINFRSKHKYILKYHRLNYNSLFNYKLKSKQLSYFFKNLSSFKGNFIKVYLLFEMSILFILIRCCFANSIESSRCLIENGYVFINFKVCYNSEYILKKGDIVNIIISLKLSLHYRHLLSLNNSLAVKVPSSYFKYLNLKNKPYKTQEKSKKAWVLKLLYNGADIPKFVQVDYISSTIIVLYNPLSNIDIYPLFFSEFKLAFSKLYNWKYLY